VLVSNDLDLRRLGESQFAVLVFERGLAHLTQLHWTTRITTLEPVLPYALSTSRTERTRSAVLELERVLGEPCLVTVALSRETIWARIASAEQPALAEAETWLRACFAPESSNDPSERQVSVSFWSYGTYANGLAEHLRPPLGGHCRELPALRPGEP
jgi:hypothetical protein